MLGETAHEIKSNELQVPGNHVRHGRMEKRISRGGDFGMENISIHSIEAMANVIRFGRPGDTPEPFEVAIDVNAGKLPPEVDLRR